MGNGDGMKVTYEFFNQDRCLEKWMEDWVLLCVIKSGRFAVLFYSKSSRLDDKKCAQARARLFQLKTWIIFKCKVRAQTAQSRVALAGMAKYSL